MTDTHVFVIYVSILYKHACTYTHKHMYERTHAHTVTHTVTHTHNCSWYYFVIHRMTDTYVLVYVLILDKYTHTRVCFHTYAHTHHIHTQLLCVMLSCTCNTYISQYLWRHTHAHIHVHTRIHTHAHTYIHVIHTTSRHTCMAH
jgi:hypothetical protein